MKLGSSGRLMIPSLAIFNFVTGTPMIVISLFLVDIARSFSVPVGIAGQLPSSFSAMTVIFSLLLGVLSVRFGYKMLITAGLFFISVSALCCYFVQDLTTMLLVYSMSGIGFSTIGAMSPAIIGEYLPVEKRGTALGWIIAGLASAYLTAPVLGFLGNWRLAFLAFTPVALSSLFLALNVLPSSPSKQASVGSYLQGFREILRNRSAMACLLGVMLRATCWQVLVYYSTSFYRQRYSLPTGFASITLTIAALAYISGSLLGGRFLNRFGRKPLTVLAIFLLGLCAISYTYVPNFWLSLALSWLGCVFSGMGLTTSNSLSLEQVPRFRGSMMSVNQAAINTGAAVGNSLCGLMLLLYGYEAAGLSLGIIGVVGSSVFLFLTIDPTRRAIAQEDKS